MYNIFRAGRITPERNPNANCYNYYVMRRPRKRRYPYGSGRRRNLVRSNVRRCLYRRHFQAPSRINERTRSPQPSTSGVSRFPAAPDKHLLSSSSSDSTGGSSDDFFGQPPLKISCPRGSRSRRIIRSLFPVPDQSAQPIDGVVPGDPRSPADVQNPPERDGPSPITVSDDTPPPITPEGSVSIVGITLSSGLSPVFSPSIFLDSGIQEFDATRNEILSSFQMEDTIQRMMLLKKPNDALKFLKEIEVKLFTIMFSIEPEYMAAMKESEKGPEVIEISDDDDPLRSPEGDVLELSHSTEVLTINSTFSEASGENTPKLPISPIAGCSQVNAPSTSKAGATNNIPDTPQSPVENLSVSTLEGCTWLFCTPVLEGTPQPSPASSNNASKSEIDSLTAVEDLLFFARGSGRHTVAVQTSPAANKLPESSRNLQTPVTPASAQDSTPEDQGSEPVERKNSQSPIIIDDEEEAAPATPELNAPALISITISSSTNSIQNDENDNAACSTPKPSVDVSLMEVFRGMSPILVEDDSSQSRLINDQTTELIWNDELEHEIRTMMSHLDARMRRSRSMLNFMESQIRIREIAGPSYAAQARARYAGRQQSAGPPILIHLEDFKRVFKEERIRYFRKQLRDLDKQLAQNAK